MYLCLAIIELGLTEGPPPGLTEGPPPGPTEGLPPNPAEEASEQPMMTDATSGQESLPVRDDHCSVNV